VQTWQTDRQWDAVVCIYLLEHVDDPARAVENLLRWTRPGGLLVIAVPNLDSLKGMVTRATPFGFHHWFYEHIYRLPYAIFPTTMRLAIAPRRLRRQVREHDVVHEEYAQEHFGPSVRFFIRTRHLDPEALHPVAVASRGFRLPAGGATHSHPGEG
jgi:SAM-dependent methyltransferase